VIDHGQALADARRAALEVPLARQRDAHGLAALEHQLQEAVAEAAVVGVPDERWGEACLAFVVLDREATEDGLLEHCRARLARYKVPKGVRFVESLPRNALDKVVKAELLELARKEPAQ
jgi:acyl-CoA synthetase (AMP-forming)/AMP-acid ligase II